MDLCFFGSAGTSAAKGRGTEFAACTPTALLCGTLEGFSMFVILHSNVVQLGAVQN